MHNMIGIMNGYFKDGRITRTYNGFTSVDVAFPEIGGIIKYRLGFNETDLHIAVENKAGVMIPLLSIKLSELSANTTKFLDNIKGVELHSHWKVTQVKCKGI